MHSELKKSCAIFLNKDRRHEMAVNKMEDQHPGG